MKHVLKILGIILLIAFLNRCGLNYVEKENLARQWMITEFNGYTKDFLVKSGGYIDFSPTKTNPNQYGAYMGCNQMFLNAEFLSEREVKFSNIGGTEMYCEETMKLEQDFVQKLPEMKAYKVEGHFLTLSDGKGNTMKFVAADWD